MEEIFKNIKNSFKDLMSDRQTSFNNSIYGVVYDEQQHGDKARESYRNAIKTMGYEYRLATRDEVIDAEALEVYSTLLSYGLNRNDISKIGKQFINGDIHLDSKSEEKK